jgi:hypothetical protein
MILNHLSDAVSITGIGNIDEIITEVTTVTLKAENLCLVTVPDQAQVKKK